MHWKDLNWHLSSPYCPDNLRPGVRQLERLNLCVADVHLFKTEMIKVLTGLFLAKMLPDFLRLSSKAKELWKIPNPDNVLVEDVKDEIYACAQCLDDFIDLNVC